ncbi:MAG: LON peptidase substrate-binding domain-containing protein [Chitinophagales bacterium]|nr:LON peptidase substrate-binding domain-containing protein [Chitinophagales bacterium]
MEDLLPIFPLSLVVFPGEKLNLHVFETRYKQLVNEALANTTNFGIPCFLNGKLCPRGTEVEIQAVERVYSKGEMDISTVGLRRFSIVEVHKQVPDKLYSVAKVRWMEDKENGDNYLRDEILGMLRELHQTLRISKEKLDDVESFSCYKIAHYIGFNLEQEYELMGLDSERERQFMILHHLKQILPVVQETERLKERIRANGHFKNLDPPNF